MLLFFIYLFLYAVNYACLCSTTYVSHPSQERATNTTTLQPYRGLQGSAKRGLQQQEALPTESATDGGKSKPIAWIHIGPHKTASTHLQSHLHQSAAYLDSLNLYYHRACDGSKMGIKDTTCIRECLLGTADCWKCYLCFANNAANEGRNILFSSENLAFSTPIMVLRLKNQLDERFDVRVIAVYREFTQLLFSHYVFMCINPVYVGGYLGGDRMQEGFMPFLFEYFPVRGGDEYPYNFKLMLDVWIGVLGREKVTVIDYYGVLRSTSKDMIQVFLCDIIQVNIL
jgi:hypothetical protein